MPKTTPKTYLIFASTVWPAVEGTVKVLCWHRRHRRGRQCIVQPPIIWYLDGAGLAVKPSVCALDNELVHAGIVLSDECQHRAHVNLCHLLYVGLVILPYSSESVGEVYWLISNKFSVSSPLSINKLTVVGTPDLTSQEPVCLDRVYALHSIVCNLGKSYYYLWL